MKNLTRPTTIRTRFPTAHQILAGFEEAQPLLAERCPEELDLRFGPRERQRIDFFRADAPSAPLMVFIHGGYWQMRRKETFRFLAAGALHHGISVALPGYTLGAGTKSGRDHPGDSGFPAAGCGKTPTRSGSTEPGSSLQAGRRGGILRP